MCMLISMYTNTGRFKKDSIDGLWSQLHFGYVMHYYVLDESGVVLKKQKRKPIKEKKLNRVLDPHQILNITLRLLSF